ncbi:metal ABC transporter substrate-binding protein [Pleurocapsa sp. FMAR1]|uniref:metal ABC transporter substrate-binding protein n=1 Tax=Pleurocapsa sp. FMAR1 TaxID=3040204 RepID=UPI0029C98B62|nr:metal ABC transporter substrate-binding protein [Pleurocapsa sp. FMAR1]
MLKNIRIKNIINLAVLSIAASLVGYGANAVQAETKPKVVASHNVICDLVKTIAQDTVDLTCLIDGNQDPHTFRPTPSQRKAIEEAQIIFYGGYQLEPQVIKLLNATKTPAPKIAVYEQAVTKPILAEHDEHEETEEKKPNTNKQADLEPDPHVWNNVENTVAMVELLKGIFLQANPAAADVYLKNSVDLTQKLWQLDAWIKDQIATIPENQRVLVTTHDSFNYYVQAYRLKNYDSLQGLSTNTSPTASQVRELATEIRQTGVPTIFAESTANDRVINNVARAANAKLSKEKLYADGLGGSNNYIEMMSHNTCAIVDGLGGKCQPFK